MNRTMVLIVFSLIACCELAPAKDAGFNGTWLLDKDSPQPVNAPNEMKAKIKQKGTRVTIESTFSEPADGKVPLLYLGVMVNRVRLDANGKPQHNMIGPVHLQTNTTITGNQMLTEWRAATQGAQVAQVEGHWTHTLKDANHLVLQIQECPTNGQEARATLFFVREE